VKQRRAAIITASNRASKGVYADESGAILADGLTNLGFSIASQVILPDDVTLLSAEIGRVLASEIDLIVTTGGTGISPTDVTPEATAPHIEKILAGVSEALRAYGREKTPFADLSRGLAGIHGKVFILNLPGSPGGVRDGLVIIERMATHIFSQLAGEDH
jgi:molybdenum cofactor synthesis domain-containing protein